MIREGDIGAECSKQGGPVSITQRLCSRDQLEMIRKQKSAYMAGAQWMRGRDTQDEAREVNKGLNPQSLVTHEETGFYSRWDGKPLESLDTSDSI